ncbi:MAG: HEAT repeat domain-containing protein, partial [Candidatus Geothermincolales bacterium]
PVEEVAEEAPAEVPLHEEKRLTPEVAAELIREGKWRDLVEQGSASAMALVRLVEKGGPMAEKASVILSKMGEDAVEGLLEALDLGVDRGLVEPILRSLGWRSLEDEAYARQLVHQGKWEEAAKLGSPAVRPLVEMLESGEPDKRERAAYLLGLIGSSRASISLQRLLKEDPVPSVRKRAAWSLGRLRDRGSLVALVEALRDSSDQVRRVVAQALERKGWTPSSIREKALFLVATHQWGALVALGEEAVETVREMADDREPEVRENLDWVIKRLQGD